MNIDNGRVYSAEEYESMLKLSYEPSVLPVPAKLAGEAQRTLAGRKQATVDLAGKSRLAKWASAKRKARRKAERRARKANRT